MNKLEFIVLAEINISAHEAKLNIIVGFKSEFKCRTNGKEGGIMIFYKKEHKILQKIDSLTTRNLGIRNIILKV